MNKYFYLALFSLVYSCIGDDAEAPAGPSYSTPRAVGDIYLEEPFDADDALESWTLSKATKDGVDSDISKYDGKWVIAQSIENALPGDSGLLLKDKAKHHAVSMRLKRPFVFDGKPFIMQYEVNFQTGIECGGGYVKLLSQSDDLDLDKFHDKTPYTIMFGPDKCGEDYKLHFIFRHKNPKTGEYEEKHAKKPTTDFKSYYTDKASHLYTLVVNPDNSFKIYIDQTEINSGNLLTDMSPPVNPPKEIEDKDDKKPEDWDEREKIPDPTASKPDDWDEDAPKKIVDSDAEMPDDWLEEEPLYIDDPDAAKPEDWDDEMDGEWEAPKVDNPKCKDAPGCGPWEPPMIDNPNFKGKWHAPLIANPKYKGIWKPRMIPNPNYFDDQTPYKMTPIGAIGFELWSMSESILFDNILITSDKSAADDYAEKTWKLKKAVRAENEKIKRILKNKESEKRRREKRKKEVKSRTGTTKKKKARKTPQSKSYQVRNKNTVKRKKRKNVKRSKSRPIKPGVVAGLMKALDEKPWLWIIVVLVVGLPLILIYSFCCGGSTKKHPKKTDEPTEDDPHENEPEEENADDTQEEDAAAESQGDEEEKSKEEEEKGTGDGKPVTKADLEEDDEPVEDSSEALRRSPRKRKVRVQD